MGSEETGGQAIRVLLAPPFSVGGQGASSLQQRASVIVCLHGAGE